MNSSIDQFELMKSRSASRNTNTVAKKMRSDFLDDRTDFFFSGHQKGGGKGRDRVKRLLDSFKNTKLRVNQKSRSQSKGKRKLFKTTVHSRIVSPHNYSTKRLKNFSGMMKDSPKMLPAKRKKSKLS
jgi:hypothetical protein